jgi:hypothetical protein
MGERARRGALEVGAADDGDERDGQRRAAWELHVHHNHRWAKTCAPRSVSDVYVLYCTRRAHAA